MATDLQPEVLDHDLHDLAGELALGSSSGTLSDADHLDVADSDHEPDEFGSSGPPARRRSLSSRLTSGIDWPTTLWLVLVHVGVLAAPLFFTWKAVALTVVLYWLTGGIGICLGFHRLFTHASFVASRPVRWVIALLGGLAGQGSVIQWVATHRKHHAHSDHDGDPHTPLHGSWWSHMFWLLPKHGHDELDSLHHRWAPDLMRDPVLRWLDRLFIPIHLAFGLALFATGAIFWNAYTGGSFVIWGMFVRLTIGLHSTWLVNSATHIWGYRNYQTEDESRNLWWVALLTFGEGWHNNHHAHPRMANNGHRWWEFDITYQTIRLCEKLGIFHHVAHNALNRRLLRDGESDSLHANNTGA
jgi:stearoyl-CoA desaturase (delta-9 desaturase)